MSQHLHKHYFPPVCILTHCWCCGLRSAVVTAAVVTSFLAACGFVFSVHGLIFGIYATASYAQEYYMEKQFNESMYVAYKKFNRSADEICLVRAALTSTAASDSSGRRRRQAQHINLDRMRPELYRIFNDDEIAQLAVNRLDYSTAAGIAHARQFWQEYRRWRMRRMMRSQNNPRKRYMRDEGSFPSLYNYHYLLSKGGIEDDHDGRGPAEDLCNAPYLIPRVRVDKTMNTLRIVLFGHFLLRAHRGVLALCLMDLVASSATLVACALLICGVMRNSPSLIVPWLVVTPYFVILNVVYVDTHVSMFMATQRNPEFTSYINPVVFLLSALVIVFIILAIFSVASYLYLTYTTGFYLHQFPRSTQVVASGTTDELATDELEEIKRTMKALEKSKREQKK